MSQKNPTAALIVIGNEILSGRTIDKNINYIAKGLIETGVDFKEVKIIPDIRQTIIDTVKEYSQNFNYVFTTGGIGPTHDDITTEAVAATFGLELVRHEESYDALNKYYNGELNEGRLKMVMLPKGAEAIPNPISTAPGFNINNIYTMAGIPNVMQAMFDSVKHTLKGGKIVQSKELRIYASESKIAQPLNDLQNDFANVEIGSYPFVLDNKIGTSLVLRSSDGEVLNECLKKLEVITKEFERA